MKTRMNTAAAAAPLSATSATEMIQGHASYDGTDAGDADPIDTGQPGS